jgi:Predicted membrane protein
MYALWWVIAGLITGWATGKIMRGPGHIPIVDIVTGIAGAVVGGCMMRAIGSQAQGGNILVAIGSAMVLTVMYGLLIEGRECRMSDHANMDDERHSHGRRKIA